MFLGSDDEGDFSFGPWTGCDEFVDHSFILHLKDTTADLQHASADEEDEEEICYRDEMQFLLNYRKSVPEPPQPQKQEQQRTWTYSAGFPRDAAAPPFGCSSSSHGTAAVAVDMRIPPSIPEDTPMLERSFFGIHEESFMEISSPPSSDEPSMDHTKKNLRPRLGNGRAATANNSCNGDTAYADSGCIYPTVTPAAYPNATDNDDDSDYGVPTRRKRKTQRQQRTAKKLLKQQQSSGTESDKETCPAEDDTIMHTYETYRLPSGRRKQFRQLPANVQNIFNKAVKDKFLNPADWLCVHVPDGRKYPKKCEEIMRKTKLSIEDVRFYMHNNARKGKRLAGFA